MKKICLILCIVLALAIFAGCSGGNTQSSTPVPSPAQASSAAAPAQGGKDIVMATEAGFRPYEYLDDADMSKVIGIDVDIAEEIAKELGRNLVVNNMPFDAIIASVNTGKADFGAAGLSVTEERKAQVDFTITYATSKQVILTKSDSGVNGEADLNGKSVGVQLGTVADIVLSDDYPEVKVEQYNKYFDAVSDLVNGRISAIVLDFLPAQELLKTAGGLVILEQELFTDEYAICVKKENKELLDAINKVLERLISEGKIDEFTMNHLGE